MYSWAALPFSPLEMASAPESPSGGVPTQTVISIT